MRSDNNYTLIRKVNLIKSGFSNKKFEITFDGINENEIVEKSENYFTVTHSNKNYCFHNALVYVLFQNYKENITDNNKVDKVKIDITADITNIREFNSDKILIKFSQFNYDTYVDTGFGFIGKDKYIHMGSSLFSGFIDDSLKRYALILLEKYYNRDDNGNERDKIKDLCMNTVVSGGGKKRHNRTRKKSN